MPERGKKYPEESNLIKKILYFFLFEGKRGVHCLGKSQIVWNILTKKLKLISWKETMPETGI